MPARFSGALPAVPTGGRLRRPPVRRRREILLAYLLALPAFLFVLGVLAYPVAWQGWTSLTNRSVLLDGPPSFVGLDNYLALLGDSEYRRAAAHTAVYFVITTVAKLVVGVALALLLARPFPGRAVAFLAVFLPWAYPAGVTIIGWYWTLNPPLIAPHSLFLGRLKWSVDTVLGFGAYDFLSVVLFNIWRGGSFTAVFLLAGLNAIPQELFDSAALECKAGWRRFWFVTLPLLRRFMALAVFLSLTTAFADLANIWVLTGGRIMFPVIGTQAYWLGVNSGQFGAAAAVSLSLVPPLALALAFLFRLFDPPPEQTA
ncbi:MAG: sugar ABC transporter permease [Candidatus Rokubacteria bacterium]|nr:sugar ABC transporter permease [Candidatus Rokubacteria bacterium]